MNRTGDGALLVLGATGAVGQALLGRLTAADAPVIAWSRPRDGDLFAASLPPSAGVLSAGPIDGLVSALRRSPACVPATLVALSSSSAHFKQGSASAAERSMAAALLASERSLATLCESRGTRCVILRPTLIYGGEDRAHFRAVAAQARRVGMLVLPRSARGLRMPIHAEDLAASMLGALDRSHAAGSFDVGGGETLPYDVMLQRVLRARHVPPRTLRVPDALFRLLLGCAHRAGLLLGLTRAMVLRMRDDLLVDDTPARAEFGHAPGPFRP